MCGSFATEIYVSVVVVVWVGVCWGVGGRRQHVHALLLAREVIVIDCRQAFKCFPTLSITLHALNTTPPMQTHQAGGSSLATLTAAAKPRLAAFSAFHPDAMALLPAFIQQAYPIVVTAKSAVTRAVMDKVTTSVADGSGFAAVAREMATLHNLGHDRRMLAYASHVAFWARHGQGTLSGPGSATWRDAVRQQPYPRQSRFHPRAGYLRTMYMVDPSSRMDRSYLDRFMASITSDMVAADEHFKPSRRVLLSDNTHPSCTYTIMCTRTKRVMGSYWLRSQDHDDKKPFLCAVAKRCADAGQVSSKANVALEMYSASLLLLSLLPSVLLLLPSCCYCCPRCCCCHCPHCCCCPPRCLCCLLAACAALPTVAPFVIHATQNHSHVQPVNCIWVDNPTITESLYKDVFPASVDLTARTTASSWTHSTSSTIS